MQLLRLLLLTAFRQGCLRACLGSKLLRKDAEIPETPASASADAAHAATVPESVHAETVAAEAANPVQAEAHDQSESHDVTHDEPDAAHAASQDELDAAIASINGTTLEDGATGDSVLSPESTDPPKPCASAESAEAQRTRAIQGAEENKKWLLNAGRSSTSSLIVQAGGEITTTAEPVEPVEKTASKMEEDVPEKTHFDVEDTVKETPPKVEDAAKEAPPKMEETVSEKTPSKMEDVLEKTASKVEDVSEKTPSKVEDVSEKTLPAEGASEKTLSNEGVSEKVTDSTTVANTTVADSAVAAATAEKTVTADTTVNEAAAGTKVNETTVGTTVNETKAEETAEESNPAAQAQAAREKDQRELERHFINEPARTRVGPR